jgi:hypothetical protein
MAAPAGDLVAEMEKRIAVSHKLIYFDEELAHIWDTYDPPAHVSEAAIPAI